MYILMLHVYNCIYLQQVITEIIYFIWLIKKKKVSKPDFLWTILGMQKSPNNLLVLVWHSHQTKILLYNKKFNLKMIDANIF